MHKNTSLQSIYFHYIKECKNYYKNIKQGNKITNKKPLKSLSRKHEFAICPFYYVKEWDNYGKNKTSHIEQSKEQIISRIFIMLMIV